MNQNLIAEPVVRRVTANIPRRLLTEAMKATGSGITETLVQGLEMVKRRRAFEKAMHLKGKLRLRINLDESRERPGC